MPFIFIVFGYICRKFYNIFHNLVRWQLSYVVISLLEENLLYMNQVYRTYKILSSLLDESHFDTIFSVY